MAKSYEELTFTDDFLFCKILYQNPKLCKELLELILGQKIRKISYVEKQKSADAAYDGKGIRLDVYAESEDEEVYDLEMQNAGRGHLSKRSRYYQGMMDLQLMERGAAYAELKKSYIIFICVFDPFGQGRHIYTFENKCREVEDLCLGDECVKIFLNAKGTAEDVSKEMKEFLNYLVEGKAANPFLKKLDYEVKQARRSRNWRAEYMTFEMKLREVRDEGREEGREEGRNQGRMEGIAAGKAEDILELLSDLGEVPADLQREISRQQDFKVLKSWLKLAVRAESIEDFQIKMADR